MWKVLEGDGFGQGEASFKKFPPPKVFPHKKRPNPLNDGFGFFSARDRDLVLLIGLNVDDLLAVVKAANLAHAVRLHDCVTSRVGALAHAGHRELAVVGASLISAGFRYFLLWYCHIYTSSCTHARVGRRA